MLFFAPKAVPLCQVTCESPGGVLEETKCDIGRYMVGEESEGSVSDFEVGTESVRNHDSAQVLPDDIPKTAPSDVRTPTKIAKYASASTNTPPFEVSAISCKLSILSTQIKDYKETKQRVDTIRDLHQALNQAKTLNLLLRQRLKEIRHECNVLTNSNAHLPPVDPLYQAVWMAGVFPKDKFVQFYRQNSQRIQLLYIQYQYKFGGSEADVCHSYGFHLFLREYLGCANYVQPLVPRSAGSGAPRRARPMSRSLSKDSSVLCSLQELE